MSELGSTASLPQDGFGLVPAQASFKKRLAMALEPWRRRPLGVIGAVIIFVSFFMALTAPLIAPYDPRDFVGDRLESPNSEFWFGTNLLGQDVLSRMIYGAQVSLAVALSSTVIGVGIGTFLGVLSAYYGGWVDLIVQRILEVLASFPGIILILMIVLALGRPSGVEEGNFVTLAWGLRTLSLAIAMNLVFGVMRVIRSATLKERELVYVEAARVIGAGPVRIMFRHILPNVFPYVIVTFSSLIGFIVLVEAGISFLGYGVSIGTPSWGFDLSGRNRDFFFDAPWMMAAPGIALTLTVMGFNFLGDTLRDILDPRLRGSR